MNYLLELQQNLPSGYKEGNTIDPSSVLQACLHFPHYCVYNILKKKKHKKTHKKNVHAVVAE